MIIFGLFIQNTFKMLNIMLLNLISRQSLNTWYKIDINNLVNNNISIKKRYNRNR